MAGCLCLVKKSLPEKVTGWELSDENLENKHIPEIDRKNKKNPGTSSNRKKEKVESR